MAVFTGNLQIVTWADTPKTGAILPRCRDSIPIPQPRLRLHLDEHDLTSNARDDVNLVEGASPIAFHDREAGATEAVPGDAFAALAECVTICHASRVA
jgi:hypothetical protein